MMTTRRKLSSHHRRMLAESARVRTCAAKDQVRLLAADKRRHREASDAVVRAACARVRTAPRGGAPAPFTTLVEFRRGASVERRGYAEDPRGMWAPDVALPGADE